MRKHLICSVFAKWETGQAVAQFLKGGNKEMSSLTAPFFSKQHDQEIKCETFSSFYKPISHSPCWSNSKPILLFVATVKQLIKYQLG
jgi:hypothetical protein